MTGFLLTSMGSGAGPRRGGILTNGDARTTGRQETNLLEVCKMGGNFLGQLRYEAAIERSY